MMISTAPGVIAPSSAPSVPISPCLAKLARMRVSASMRQVYRLMLSPTTFRPADAPERACSGLLIPTSFRYRHEHEVA